VQNIGREQVSLVGATLSDASNNLYLFPAQSLPPGARVRVHSGAGDDTDDDLYWGRDRPVWNNSGDLAVLRDADGLFVDSRLHEGRR
jgi:micrococcal nuclease